MPHLNEVRQIGRLTREVELRTTASGMKIAKFGIANNERKKNTQTGQWEDGKPMFIDVTCFGWLADHVAANFRKGMEVFIAGRIELDQWDDKQTGAKRSKHGLIADVAFGVSWPKKGEAKPAAGDYSGPSEPAPAYQEPGADEVPF